MMCYTVWKILELNMEHTLLSGHANIVASFLYSQCLCWHTLHFPQKRAPRKNPFGYWTISMKTVAIVSIKIFIGARGLLLEFQELSMKSAFRLCCPLTCCSHALYFLGSASTLLGRPSLLSLFFLIPMFLFKVRFSWDLLWGIWNQMLLSDPAFSWTGSLPVT